jgi:hypothetical protein
MNHLFNETKGAVMVMATFVAIILVGLVYHVAGVGDACLEQQIMQDAADASAFSAATVNARGMNIIALLNLIMVALLTILVALRLVQAIMTIAVAAVTVICAVPVPGAQASCALITPLEQVRSRLDDIADQYQDIAKQIIKGLHSAENGVSKIIPFVALAEGIAIAARKPYAPPANFGIVWPIGKELPLKDGTYSELCKRAGQNIMTPLKYTFPIKGFADFLDKTLGSLLGELTETFSGYFCGDDGNGNTPNKPAPRSLNREVGYPPGADSKNEKMWNCIDDQGYGRLGREGQCISNQCRECAKTGCDFCLNAMKNNNKYVKGYWTVVENEWVEWCQPQEDGGCSTVRVLSARNRKDLWSTKTMDDNPCDSKRNPNSGKYLNQRCADYGGAWQWNEAGNDPGRIPRSHEYSPRPVCEIVESDRVPLRDVDFYLLRAGIRTERETVPVMTRKRQTLFVALSSCVVKEKMEIKADSDKGSMVSSEEGGDEQEEKESMSPKVLDEEKYAEYSTLTSIVEGSRGATKRKQKVAIAIPGKKVDKSLNARLSFASAEYYSQDSLKESMWHMQWLSRLVRVNIGNSGSTGGSEDSKDSKGNNAEGADMMNSAMDNLGGQFGKGVSIDDIILH